MAVLITGGTGTIGTALVREFSRDNDVAVFYKSNTEKARQLSEEYGCTCISADITNSDAVNAAVSRIIEIFGRIDVLINNAGIAQIKLFNDISDADWNNMINVNLTGMFYVTREVSKYMIKRKKGSIINVSSVWGVHGASCEVHYSTSKAGVIGFTKALSKELAPCGVTVNCVAPGVIDSPMNSEHLSNEEMTELVNETPIGRLGTPEDVAAAVKYISSASFVTGQVLGIDGGFY